MIHRIVFLAFIVVMSKPFFSVAQDSIPTAQDLIEQKKLKFQDHFFKALSEKAIKNYQKAIEQLEFCNEIFPENISTLFELSKNYLFLNKTKEAKDYIEKALAKEANNIWMLEHLVAIYKKDRNFAEAIQIQLKVVNQNPKKQEDLARLYYSNRDYAKAIKLINILENKYGLSRNLRQLKKILEYRRASAVAKIEKNDIQSLTKSFEDDRASFSSLKKLLDLTMLENKTTFHKYGKIAIELFPAQPYAYLMRGKSLHIQKSYKKAIIMLKSGIDFVINNPKLEAEFYETMANVYLSLNEPAKASEYRSKAKKLKNIK